jgi:hypothetical protein
VEHIKVHRSKGRLLCIPSNTKHGIKIFIGTKKSNLFFPIVSDKGKKYL